MSKKSLFAQICIENIQFKKLTKQCIIFTVLESIKDKPELQKVHLGLPKEELEDQMKRQIEE